MLKIALLGLGLGLSLAACQNAETASTRHLAPIPPATMALMSSKGVSARDPILMRSFKKESEIEVWKRGTDGRYALLKTYPMCRWSGQLGPKTKEGDRQAPEGFYAVTPAQMNPNSSLYLSFNLGYPNEYDQAHGRTGAHLMVHGSCTSRGCFAMTDEAISEVYAVAREAFAGGQRSFQFQSYPFRMTAENLAKHRQDPNIAFWTNLKEGNDTFEVTREEPKVAVSSSRRYAFSSDDPSASTAVARKQVEDERKVADLVSNGTPAVRVLYDDGGQHETFREIMMAKAGESSSDFVSLVEKPTSLGYISRPEALAVGPREIPLGPNLRANADVASASPAMGKVGPSGPIAASGAPTGKKNEAIRVPAATESTGARQSERRPFYKRVLGFLSD